MTPLDTHAHVIVPELLREADPDEQWRPVLSRDSGRPVIEFAGRRIANMINECVDLISTPPGLHAGGGTSSTLRSPER